MISIAGVIGAGLFVGSKNAINEAGPAMLIAYFLAGTLVVLVLMAFDPGQQQAILLPAISAVYIVGAGVVVHRRRSREHSPV